MTDDSEASVVPKQDVGDRPVALEDNPYIAKALLLLQKIGSQLRMGESESNPAVRERLAELRKIADEYADGISAGQGQVERSGRISPPFYPAAVERCKRQRSNCEQSLAIDSEDYTKCLIDYLVCISSILHPQDGVGPCLSDGTPLDRGFFDALVGIKSGGQRTVADESG